ncbi:MAG: aminoglycoside N(3)-acetyltransferase [Halobacteriales archaeon]
MDRVETPVTVGSLVDDFRALGLAAGDTVIVHASLAALGWVCGGPPAVIDALQTVLTADGTLVMPTHSTQYSDPEAWTQPPVPDDWEPVIRAERPPFRPAVTPTRGMGAIAECFRGYPGAVRSRHPELSFAAWGANAEAITANHSFDYGLGEDSPLGRLYEQDGQVLLLGVGHDRNTSIHLAEYWAALAQDTHENTVPIELDGRTETITYRDLKTDASDFDELGAAYEAAVGLDTGSVGAATAKLLAQPSLVDFAVDWLEANR